MASDSSDVELDMNRFSEIIGEYRSSFDNPPKNTQQLVQFCKDKAYNFKYGELNPHYQLWSKLHQTPAQPTKDTTTTETPTPQLAEVSEIDWDAFWDEYQTSYSHVPKNAVHLWNFAKEDKGFSVKYKVARTAFDRLKATHVTPASPSSADVEGRPNSSTATSGSLSSRRSKRFIRLKISKYTKEGDVAAIKQSFLECLEAFRAQIQHDPVSPKQLFNFIKEETQYRARYGDVKSAYTYALKHAWFRPLRRKSTPKVFRENQDSGDEEEETSAAAAATVEREGEGHEFEVDVERLESELGSKKEEVKEEIVYKERMSDDELDALLLRYDDKYSNPPRNASQIMNFAGELKQFYKYKACRIAYQRWVNLRGSVMPVVAEPGTDVVVEVMEVVEEKDEEEVVEVVVEPGTEKEEEQDKEEEEEEEEDESV